MTDSLLLGLDIGGTKSAVILGDRNGNVLDRHQWPTADTSGPDALIRHAVEHLQRLTADRPAAALGVSIGGPLDAHRGIIHSPPNLPGWDDVPLKQRLEHALHLPVAVAHDAAACALAEHRWACPDATRLAYLTCGTGFGVGLVFDGISYVGARGRSPEIGHTRYRDHGPTAFNKTGSAEAYAAGSALPRLAAFLYPHRWPEGLPGPDLAALAADRDPDARHVIDTNADAVGHLAARLADTLALDRIVLGSLARYLGSPWLNRVRHAFTAEALPGLAAHCPITPSALGDTLQDRSTLAVALTLLQPPRP